MATVSMATMYGHLPWAPFNQTVTRATFRYGFTDKEGHREVTLHIMCNNWRGIHCLSCHRELVGGELVGEGMIGDGTFCANCIVVPDGIEAWQVTYKQRKSSRRPDGLNVQTIVGQPDRINAYLAQLRAALRGRPVEAVQVEIHLPLIGGDLIHNDDGKTE